MRDAPLIAATALAWASTFTLTGVGIAGAEILYPWGLGAVATVVTSAYLIGRRLAAPAVQAFELGVQVGEARVRKEMRAAVVVPITRSRSRSAGAG